MARWVRGHAMTGADHSTDWDPSRRVRLVSLGVGLVAFLATEFMHYLLVPDLGTSRGTLARGRGVRGRGGTPHGETHARREPAPGS